jgi:hypothetical protein
MERTDSLALLLKLVFVLGLLTLFQRSMREAMIQAMKDLVDNFRGGPPSPMHPSPANDGALLQKRKRGRQVLRGL